MSNLTAEQLKRASELYISPKEYDALQTVRFFLSEANVGKISDVDDLEIENPEAPYQFNMNQAAKTYECGTAMCIGGWVKLFMMDIELTDKMKLTLPQINEINEYVMNLDGDTDLGRLYFPDLTEEGWAKIGPKEAVQAIDNFLKTGSADWESVVGSEYVSEEWKWEHDRVSL